VFDPEFDRLFVVALETAKPVVVFVDHVAFFFSQRSPVRVVRVEGEAFDSGFKFRLRC